MWRTFVSRRKASCQLKLSVVSCRIVSCLLEKLVGKKLLEVVLAVGKRDLNPKPFGVLLHVAVSSLCSASRRAKYLILQNI